MTGLDLDSESPEGGPAAAGPTGSSGPGTRVPGERARGRGRRLLPWIGGGLALVVAIALASGTSDVPDRRSESPPAADCLVVGAAVNAHGREEGPRLGLFRTADERIGPLTMRRSFDRFLPASFAESSAAGDAAAGLHSFVSWKPPGDDHAGAAAGLYDEAIADWARSVPTTGVYATSFHEPENDMTAADFVAFQRHVYTVVKAANPTIRWGPVYMAYWWDPAEPEHYVGDPQAWWPGNDHADFAGLDWYGREPRPMTTSASFRHWYETVSPTGLPLVIAEYGQYFARDDEPPDPASEAARAAAIREDAAWLSAHPEFTAWLYWHGGDDVGTWRLRDPVSQQAWREVAAEGCPPAAEALRAG